MRPTPRRTSKPANSGTTTKPCMAMARLERTICDSWLAFPSRLIGAPSTFS